MNKENNLERLYKNLFPMGIKFELYRIENQEAVESIMNIYLNPIKNKIKEVITHFFVWFIFTILTGGITGICLLIIWRYLQ